MAGVGAALQSWDVGPGGLVVAGAGTGPGGWPPLCGCRRRARGPGARGYLIFLAVRERSATFGCSGNSRRGSR